MDKYKREANKFLTNQFVCYIFKFFKGTDTICFWYYKLTSDEKINVLSENLYLQSNEGFIGVDVISGKTLLSAKHMQVSKYLFDKPILILVFQKNVINLKQHRQKVKTHVRSIETERSIAIFWRRNLLMVS